MLLLSYLTMGSVISSVGVDYVDSETDWVKHVRRVQSAAD